MMGARPVFVDIDPLHYTMDPNKFIQTATERTRAVIPVHLYGCPAEMTPILEFARKANIYVIEDCAQAHGAMVQDRKVGSLGDVAAFSFYPTKNLGALGDGGAILTKDPVIAGKARLYRQYGWEERYISKTKGFNSRLDELQAGILRVKLRHLDGWNDHRRALANLYRELLAETELGLPSHVSDSLHVFHQFVVRHPRRDELQAYLKKQGIHTVIHYPVPVHLQPAYADLGYSLESLPYAELAAREVLSLPMCPELSEKDVERVSRSILDFFKQES
jgi:dTDP-4-amino-4,6-dideoxygalactose transaminase